MFQFGPRLFQLADLLPSHATQQQIVHCFKAQPFGHQHFHHLGAPMHPLTQPALPGRFGLIARQFQHLTHPCQDEGIQAVGLGQLAGGLGKIAYLARIHPHHRQARFKQ
ncbi:hypothetical protein D9M68_971580 [compost metagenome]